MSDPELSYQVQDRGTEYLRWAIVHRASQTVVALHDSRLVAIDHAEELAAAAHRDSRKILSTTGLWR